jgi:hypothetical protein
MSISIGLSELRAVCEYLVGYSPEGVISGFENYVYKTGDFTWTVPAGVTKIRAIICGGGAGGQAGYPGSSGSTVSGGAGGQGGAGGVGGAILEVNMAVTPGEVISGSCGTGGAGRTIEGFPSNPGEDTTFGIYSSASGRRYPYGYVEQKTGNRIALPGMNGMSGGNGSAIGNPGTPVYFEITGITWYPGADGASHTSGGLTALGGGGGGAAYGSNGGAGQDGYIDGGYLTGGGGGQGASAAGATDYSVYGGGGWGGHGGGGGGQGHGYLFGNSGGAGGVGSYGRNGSAGVVVIYY